jgi:hypothetical protein
MMFAGCVNFSSRVGNDDAHQDIAVYSAVLDSLFAIKSESGRPRPVLLRDSVDVFKREDLVTGFLEDFARVEGDRGEAAASFELRARESRSLRGLEASIRAKSRVPFQLSDSASQYRLALLTDSIEGSGADILRSGAYAYWEAFHRMYPGYSGQLELSAIGYNQRKDSAILHVMFSCGPLCAEGQIVHLKLIDSRWVIVSRRTTVVS